MKKMVILTTAVMLTLIISSCSADALPGYMSIDQKNEAIDYSNAGVKYYDKSDYENALIQFNKAIETDPGFADAYFNKGNALYHLERYDEALQMYTQAIKLNPNDKDFYRAKGALLGKLQREEEVFDMLQKAVSLGLKDLAITGWVGYRLIEKGKYDEAVKTLSDKDLLAAGDRADRNNLALALLKRNAGEDSKRANEILENVLKEDSNDSHAVYAYAALGRKDEMYKLIKKLLPQRPSIKEELKTGFEFEDYRNDPEYKSITSE